MPFKDPDRRTMAFIGFGEVGASFSRGLVESGKEVRIKAYSLDYAETAKRCSEIDSSGSILEACMTLPETLDDVETVLVAVPGSGDESALARIAEIIRPGTSVVDLSTAEPSVKVGNSKKIQERGCVYVDVAIMDTVVKKLHETPMIMSGAGADGVAAYLETLGMKVNVIGERPGTAATVKLCRSIFMKGVAALAIETRKAARVFGVGDAVFESIARSFSTPDMIGYLERLEQAAKVHRKRQHEEILLALSMEKSNGLSGDMARAAARVIGFETNGID